jgi:hypothetical protein
VIRRWLWNIGSATNSLISGLMSAAQLWGPGDICCNAYVRTWS